LANPVNAAYSELQAKTQRKVFGVNADKIPSKLVGGFVTIWSLGFTKIPWRKLWNDTCFWTCTTKQSVDVFKRCNISIATTLGIDCGVAADSFETIILPTAWFHKNFLPIYRPKTWPHNGTKSRFHLNELLL
jgi:hypothetical protein